jgi:hypothetical protein
MRIIAGLILLAAAAWCQPAPDQPPAPRQELQQRTDLPSSPGQLPQPNATTPWVVPAGTKIPIQLRRPVSTKNAAAGDPIYAQTTFPIVGADLVMIPAGTYVKGEVDAVKRAGRIRGTAELQFHLTTLIFPNGYALNLAAAIDQVPGNSGAHMKEPGTVAHDSEKGEDLKRIGTDAAAGATIGTVAGMGIGGLRGYGVGGLAGIAAGTLIAVLARGSDVRFEVGSEVDVSLNYAIGIDPEKAMRPGGLPISNAMSPVITTPVVTVEK